MLYRYVLDAEVAEDVFDLSARQRSEFIRIFRFIAENPFQMGEQSFKDSVSRDIQKKKFGHWLISYWADHTVKELRIVGIQRTKQ